MEPCQVRYTFEQGVLVATWAVAARPPSFRSSSVFSPPMRLSALGAISTKWINQPPMITVGGRVRVRVERAHARPSSKGIR
jgi:hypothetical protein